MGNVILDYEARHQGTKSPRASLVGGISLLLGMCGWIGVLLSHAGIQTRSFEIVYYFLGCYSPPLA